MNNCVHATIMLKVHRRKELDGLSHVLKVDLVKRTQVLLRWDDIRVNDLVAVRYQILNTCAP